MADIADYYNMSKFTCLVLCVVAASISRVYAGSKEKAALREKAAPIFTECSKEHGVSIEDLKAAKEVGNMNSIESCFMACIYKKVGVIEERGDFDLDIALAKIKEFVSNDDDFAKFVNIGKKCAEVSNKPVGDGQAGCERAALLTFCFWENKGELLI